MLDLLQLCILYSKNLLVLLLDASKHFFMFLLSVEGSGRAEVLQVWSVAAGGALYYYTHQGSRISPLFIYHWILTP